MMKSATAVSETKIHTFERDEKEKTETNIYKGKFDTHENDIDAKIKEKIDETMNTILNCGTRRELRKEQYKISILSEKEITKVDVTATFQFFDQDVKEISDDFSNIQPDLNSKDSEKLSDASLKERSQIIGTVGSIMQQKSVEIVALFSKLKNTESSLSSEQNLNGGEINGTMNISLQLRGIKL